MRHKPVRTRLPLLVLASASLLSGGVLAYTNPYTGIQHDSWAQAGMFTALSQMQQDNSFYLRSMDVLGDSRGRTRGREAAASGSGRQTPPGNADGAARTPGISATDFRPAGPRRVPEEFAAMLGDRGDVELLRTLHGAIDGMDGFRRHNLAYAMAFALFASIQVAENRTLDESQQYALIDLVNEFLVTGGAFESMSPRARTDAYDFFIITGALITALEEEGRKQRDRAMRDGARLLARSTLDAFGLDR
jgi:hypothetical protein